VPNVSFHVYAPGFFARFLESHAVMLQGNAGLKPKEGEVTSRPWQWPINYKVSFNSRNCFISAPFCFMISLLCILNANINFSSLRTAGKVFRSFDVEYYFSFLSVAATF
jgi:hypothetical protein